MKAAVAVVTALISMLVSAPGGGQFCHSERDRVPWWGVVSSAAAPVLLVAAWTVAASLQPGSFNAMDGTVSALAADGAAYRWVMTFAFAVAGGFEVGTALALRPAASPGRLILMAGGVAGVLVAVNPQHAGGSLTHAVWAVVGFSALVAWPAGAWRRGPAVPWALRSSVSASAVAVLLGLLAWFGVELVIGGEEAGLAERVMGLAQAGWPLVVVLSCRRSQSRAHSPAAGIGGGIQHLPATARPVAVVAFAGQHVTTCPADRRLLVIMGWRPAVGADAPLRGRWRKNRNSLWHGSGTPHCTGTNCRACACRRTRRTVP